MGLTGKDDQKVFCSFVSVDKDLSFHTVHTKIYGYIYIAFAGIENIRN